MRLRFILGAALGWLIAVHAFPVFAQSTAAQVLPGSLATGGANCPSGYCWSPYSATNPLVTTPAPLTSLGFQTYTAASATPFSSIPASATTVVVCTTGQNVNYRDDGVAPTATPGSGGMELVKDTCITFKENTFANFQFIQQSATAVLGVTWYK